jgi:Ca2+-binding RTX toxin-like protein
VTIRIHHDYVVQASEALSFTGETAFTFNARGEPLTLDNFGAIEVTGPTGFYAMFSNSTQGADLFWNHKGSSLTVTNSSGVRFEAPGAQVVNDGLIQVSEGNAVELESLGGVVLNRGGIVATATNVTIDVACHGDLIKNTGAITAQAGNFAEGVDARANTLVNTGEIRAEGDSDARGVLFGPFDTGVDDGLAHHALIRNSGSIVAVSHGNPSQGLALYSYADDNDTVTIINSGSIEGDYAIRLGFTPRVLLENSGQLVGDVDLGLYGGVVENTGSISGDLKFGLRDDIYRGAQGSLGGVLSGGGGDDRLTGGADADVIYGDQAAADHARDGDDLLRGGGGDDLLLGGMYEDTMQGGLGADTLTGGTENDVFRFERIDVSTSATSDLITDLQSGDVIDLSRIDADTTQGGDQAFTLVGSFGGHAGELVLSYDSGAGETLLQGDVDGDGQADFQVRLTGDQTGFTGFTL